MKNDFCEELKGIYKHDVFNNSTIEYCINGFMDAIGLNELDGQFEELGFREIKDKHNNKYMADVIEKKNDNDKIDILRCKGKKKDCIKILGNIDNMSFSFDNYYSHRDLEHDKTKFNIVVNISDDNNKYSMKVFNEYGCTFCVFRRVCLDSYYVDMVEFILYRNDFETVLSMLMQFIENPDYVISMYKILKNNNAFVKGKNIYLDNDIIVDKNGKKYQKIMK